MDVSENWLKGCGELYIRNDTGEWVKLGTTSQTPMLLIATEAWPEIVLEDILDADQIG